MNNSTYTTPLTELQRRIEKMQRSLAARDIDGALVVQKTDLFYFSGTAQQGWLYIPAEGKVLLMVFKEYERACADSPLPDIVSVLSSKKIPGVLRDCGYTLPGSLGMELDVLPANLYFQYSSIFDSAKIVDISTEIRLVRAVKSLYEIDKTRQAARLSDRVAARLPELVEAGKTEVQLAGELEGYARSLGHQGLVRMRMWGGELFYGHLMCGADAAVPSYLASPTGGKGVSSFIGQGPGYNTVKENEPLLFDYVFALDGYLSDHARIFVLGELPDKLKAAHQAMLEVQETFASQAKPGVATGELYDLLVAKATEKGYGEHFMGVGERRIRFIGHGVGLELDEFPFIAKGQKLRLEEGMLIALEPKTIFPGLGVVGIENTHVVTEDGLESLTKFPDEIASI